MYINVGGISAVRVFQQKSQQSRKIQGSTFYRKEQQSGKKKKWNTLKWRDEEVGGEKGRSDGQRRGTDPTLSPFPGPQCKKQWRKQSDFNFNSLRLVKWLEAFILFLFALLVRYPLWL